MGCNNAYVRIIFEEDSKVRRTDIASAVKSVQESLKTPNNRRALDISTVIGAKFEYYLFSVIDFLFVIFSAYAGSNADLSERLERKSLFFEKLRDKYQIILNSDQDVIYSRHRPFTPWLSH